MTIELEYELLKGELDLGPYRPYVPEIDIVPEEDIVDLKATHLGISLVSTRRYGVKEGGDSNGSE